MPNPYKLNEGDKIAASNITAALLATTKSVSTFEPGEREKSAARLYKRVLEEVRKVHLELS